MTTEYGVSFSVVNVLKLDVTRVPAWLSLGCLPSALIMIPRSWDRAPCQAQQEPATPSP